MKITIIGASAGLGLETVKRALQRNHEVTTLSRSAVQLEEHTSFQSVLGSATNKADVFKAIEHAEAVIVAIGTGKNMKATTLFSDVANVLVEVQLESKKDIPYMLVTGFGAGDSRNYVTWFVNLFIKYFLKEVYADKSKMEAIISGSPMKWVFVRPGRLLDAPLTEKYRVETRLFKGINVGGINRADLADFLVKQAENPTYLGQYPAVMAE